MSNKNDDFFNILSALFGIGPGPLNNSPESSSEHLDSLSMLGNISQINSLIERLAAIDAFDQDEIDIIMAKLNVLSNKTFRSLRDYKNLNDYSSLGSKKFTKDCDSNEMESVEGRLAKRMKEILDRTREYVRKEEDMSKGFYIMLMQDIHKSTTTREMKGVAFGPFKKSIAGWKMHLLENRVARYAKKKKGDMVSFMKIRKGASLDSYKWNLVCADTREHDRTSVLFRPLNVRKSSFGFIMVREDEFNGADILSAEYLKDWHLSVDKKVRAHWNIELVSKVIAGFAYDQN